MKNLILLIALVVGINSFAQEKIDNNSEISYKYDNSMTMNTDKNIITLNGNVELETSVFEFKNADKIVVNINTKEVIVSGNYTVYMNGGTIQKAQNAKKNILRYKVGEKIAYAE